MLEEFLWVGFNRSARVSMSVLLGVRQGVLKRVSGTYKGGSIRGLYQGKRARRIFSKLGFQGRWL